MSLTPEEIKSIIEERKIAAIIKKIPQKLELVLNVYGYDIMGDLGRDDYEDYYPTVPYERESEERAYIYGRKFDGGKTGLPLEILRTDHSNEMIAKWDGNRVFMQSDGHIVSFVPSSKEVETPWEDALELFYERAKKLEKTQKQKTEQEAKADRQTRFGKIVETLRDMWGIG